MFNDNDESQFSNIFKWKSNWTKVVCTGYFNFFSLFVRRVNIFSILAAAFFQRFSFFGRQTHAFKMAFLSYLPASLYKFSRMGKRGFKKNHPAALPIRNFFRVYAINE